MSDLSIVEVTRLREALIAMGRQIPGCALADDVSTEFLLLLLPEEMRLWKERSASEAERVRDACAKVAEERHGKYVEPTAWDYGTQDACVSIAAAIRSLPTGEA